jgi:hypothetical protein
MGIQSISTGASSYFLYSKKVAVAVVVAGNVSACWVVCQKTWERWLPSQGWRAMRLQ